MIAGMAYQKGGKSQEKGSWMLVWLGSRSTGTSLPFLQSFAILSGTLVLTANRGSQRVTCTFFYLGDNRIMAARTGFRLELGVCVCVTGRVSLLLVITLT